MSLGQEEGRGWVVTYLSAFGGWLAMVTRQWTLPPPATRVMIDDATVTLVAVWRRWDAGGGGAVVGFDW